jgi:class 3 adenylate cyclase
MATDTTTALIAEIAEKDVPAVYAIWAARDRTLWATQPPLYKAAARRLLRSGEPLLAFDVTREAASQWPEDVELQGLEALALARCRATGPANDLLGRLYAAGHRDEETVGMLARTYKDLWEETADPALKPQYLERAEALYSESFAGGRDTRYWSGINAATLQLLLGAQESAQRTAREVRSICAGALLSPNVKAGDRYWLQATLGEAALVLDQIELAGEHYATAAALAAGDLGNLASTRRNARLILRARGRDPQLLERWLPSPVVAVFTGHLIDAADRAQPRFPARAEHAVFAALRQALQEMRAQVSFSSAACGADILFLEAMLAQGGEINIVLPSDIDSFLQASVIRDDDTRWVERFQRVIEAAKQVIYASHHAATDVYLAYANVMMFGLAKSRARGIDGRVRALAVWDGQPGQSGGTGSAISRWRSCGQAVRAVNPLTLAWRDYGPVPGPLAPSDQWLTSESDTRPEDKRALVSLLFADAVGFSKLSEAQIPQFVTHFLGPIAALLERSKRAPIVQNTWGDALYFVFNDITAAGVLALQISELIRSIHWPDFGMPQSMGIRIGLHSGPAYPVVDPIIRGFSYTGVHVSRAARIEPITPAGAVYASQEFAALAEAVGVTEFVCQYVGVTPMAKSYGEFPTYQVRRA